MALVLHLGDVGKYVKLVWGRSVRLQESGDLHTLATTFIMWVKSCSVEKINFAKGKIKRENGNPWASGLVRLADGLCANRAPYAHMSVLVGFSQASFWSQHPSNNKIGFEICGKGATRGAYPSSWPCMERLFYW